MKYSHDIRAQVEIFAAHGKNPYEIERLLGVPHNTVIYWINPVQAERQKARSLEYRKANLDKVKAQRKEYREANRDKLKIVNRKYREANPEKCKAAIKEHYRRNSEAYVRRALIRYRRLVELPMTDLEKLMCSYYYQDAKRLTEETGIIHEVDHIWPVSKGGPHLPWNLRVITREENRKKSNNI